MKPLCRYLVLIVLTLSLTTVMTGCSKNDDPQTPPRDYAELFKNTVWTGEYQQDGFAHPKPYSLEFVVGNAFIFHDFYGNFAGTYTLEQNKITLDIPGISAKLSATVTNDNKFSQFKKIGTQAWTMLSGEYNILVNQTLDNTFWKGKFSDGSNMEVYFKPGAQAILESDLRPSAVTYTRKAGTIRCTFPSSGNTFSVLQLNNTIKGVWSDQYTFSLTKK